MTESNESFTAQFGLASLYLTLFGTGEALLGSLFVHNPALVADAGHNLADSLVVLFFLGIEVLADRAVGHWWNCTLRRLAGIAALAFTVAAIGYFVYGESGQQQSRLGPLLVMPIGLAGFLLNFWLSKRLRSGTNANAQGNSNHLRVDAFLSLTLVLSSPAAYFVHSNWPNVWGAIVILVVVAIHNVGEIWELAQGFHRAHNHIPGQEKLQHHDHGSDHAHD